MRINLEGFIFPVSGGEIVYPHDPETFPANAEFVSFDAETLTVAYTVPSEVEGEESTEGTVTFTEEQIPVHA